MTEEYSYTDSVEPLSPRGKPARLAQTGARFEHRKVTVQDLHQEEASHEQLPLDSAPHHRADSSPTRNNMQHTPSARKLTRRVPTHLLVLTATLVLGIGLVGIGVVSIPSCATTTSEGQHAQIAATSNPGMPATPSHLWATGSLPYLYQTQSEWASVSYAGGTIDTHGCGPTCLSMVYIARTGDTSMDPAQMAAYSETNGYVEDGMTAWRFMSDGARALGLEVSEIYPTTDSIQAALSEDKYIIVAVDPGPYFTTEGHYMVISNITENGELILHDPNSPENSLRTWSIDIVLNQVSNLWAY